MTPRRKQTNEEIFCQESQPVRFYKFVAVTFLLITIVLLGVIIFISNKKATIIVSVKSEPVEASENLTIGEKNSPVDGKTAIVKVSLSKKFNPTEGREEESVATGRVVLHNETNYNQPLVATTRLLTADNIMFRLKDRIMVPASGTAEANVYADKPGRESEIGPSKFTIPGLSPDKQAVIYATSDQPMTGGLKRVGILGENDWKKVQNELLADLEKLGQEKLSVLNQEYSGVYKIIENKIESSNKVGDEGSEFEIQGSAVVAGVFYKPDQLKQLSDKKLREKIVSEDQVLTINEQAPVVNLESYNASSTTTVVNVFGSGLVTLNPESKKLDKSVFFGKSRDEVRRYLLSLDYVNGVEVKFSPAWILSVPSIAENVSVIIKNVQ